MALETKPTHECGTMVSASGERSREGRASWLVLASLPRRPPVNVCYMTNHFPITPLLFSASPPWGALGFQPATGLLSTVPSKCWFTGRQWPGLSMAFDLHLQLLNTVSDYPGVCVCVFWSMCDLNIWLMTHDDSEVQASAWPRKYLSVFYWMFQIKEAFVFLCLGPAPHTAVWTCTLWGQGRWSSPSSSRRPSMTCTATRSTYGGITFCIHINIL